MKYLVKISVICLIVSFFFSGTAYSSVLTNKYISDCIKKDVTSQVNSVVDGKVDVEVGEIPYKSIEVPNGNIKVKSTVNLKFFMQRTLARIVVSVNDKDIRTFGVPVKLNVYNDVWVAKDFIRRGEAISIGNVSLERKNITDMAQNALSSKVEPMGSLVRKTFTPGDIIDARFVESAPIVSKSSHVSVMFKSSLITITIPCEALDNGKIGDLVRVRSKQYKKDYTGRVTDSGMVLVNI